MTRNLNIETVESKICKFGCGRTLFFSKFYRWYSDDPDGKIRHRCNNQDVRINEDISYKIDQLNRNTLHNTSLLQEIRIKLDAALERNIT